MARGTVLLLVALAAGCVRLGFRAVEVPDAATSDGAGVDVGDAGPRPDRGGDGPPADAPLTSEAGPAPDSGPPHPVVYNWVKSYGSSSMDEAGGVALDPAGNVYISGQFYSTVNLGGADLVSQGDRDILVASFTRQGAHRWSKSFGGPYVAVSEVIRVDASSNVYIGGRSDSLTDFGGGPLSKGGVVVASFTSTGSHRWSLVADGPNNANVMDGCIDSQGSFHPAGYFWTGTLSFGTPMPCAGYEDGWLASLSSQGSHRWSSHLYSTGQSTGTAVGCDGAGNIYVGAQSTAALYMGGPGLPNYGSWDVYLASYDSSGKHRWSKQFGTASSDSIRGIAADAQNRVYAVGSGGGLDFGGGALAAGGYLVSLDSSGKHLWSKALPGLDPVAVAVDAKGMLLVVGKFSGTASIGTSSLVSAGGSDVFLAQFSPAGVPLWATRFGGPGSEGAADLAVDVAGYLVISGTFSGTTDLGGGPLTSAGSSDVFILHLKP